MDSEEERKDAEMPKWMQCLSSFAKIELNYHCRITKINEMPEKHACTHIGATLSQAEKDPSEIHLFCSSCNLLAVVVAHTNNEEEVCGADNLKRLICITESRVDDNLVMCFY